MSRRSVWVLIAIVLLGLGACDDPLAFEQEVISWQALSVGENHACAADQTGNVYCWGSNDRGQLSAPTGQLSPLPTLAVIGWDVRTLTSGSGYTCSTAGGGSTTCWGEGRLGQLGDGRPFSNPIGTRVAGGPWTQLSAGMHHTCALSEAGSFCWGGDRYGASLGADLPVQSRCTDPISQEFWYCALDPEPIAVEPLSFVSAGLWQSCGVGSSGSVYCWGYNGLAQLGFEPTQECRFVDPLHGDGFFPCAFEPQQVTLPGAARQVEAGASHTCAVLLSGDVYCWGGWSTELDRSVLYDGQLGYGGAEGSAAPVRVASDETFVSVSTSRLAIWTTTCGLTADGRAFCWGSNRNGALGVAAAPSQCVVAGTINCALTPIAVETDARFTTLEVGEQFVCGLTTDARILCWGFNDEGQLGDGTLVSRSEPREVVPVG